MDKFFVTALAIILSVFLYIECAQAAESTKAVSSPRCNEFTFDATASSDPDNENLDFLWNFGDGQTSQEPVVNHTYEQSGDYTVTLTITDNAGLECSQAVTTQLVRANIPPIADFDSPSMICTNEEVAFDSSQSEVSTKTEPSYHWDFGDGTRTSNQKKVVKSYVNGGDYKVSLTIDDNSQTDNCSRDTLEKSIHVNAPPVAKVKETIIEKCVSTEKDMVIAFDGSASSDANKDPLLYVWDFGDGQKAQGATATHTYAETGVYDAKLIVKDNSPLECSTGVDFVSVKLTSAPKANAGEDVIACSGEHVEFDASESLSDRKGTLSYSWAFGDGEGAAGAKVGHTFTKPGKYESILTVTDGLNAACKPSVDTRVVQVNSAPKIQLASVSSVCLGTSVDFEATAIDDDKDSLEYYWTFGDGTILRSGSKVSHQYKQGGRYRVSVIVDDGRGSACSTATAFTNVHVNTPPIANAGENLACCVDRKTAFDASTSTDADGDQLTYTWDFGDGIKATGAVVDHNFTKSGNYNVTVTVDDNSGTTCSQSTAGFTASVNSTPVPVINIR